LYDNIRYKIERTNARMDAYKEIFNNIWKINNNLVEYAMAKRNSYISKKIYVKQLQYLIVKNLQHDESIFISSNKISTFFKVPPFKGPLKKTGAFKNWKVVAPKGIHRKKIILS